MASKLITFVCVIALTGTCLVHAQSLAADSASPAASASPAKRRHKKASPTPAEQASASPAPLFRSFITPFSQIKPRQSAKFAVAKTELLLAGSRINLDRNVNQSETDAAFPNRTHSRELQSWHNPESAVNRLDLDADAMTAEPLVSNLLKNGATNRASACVVWVI